MPRAFLCGVDPLSGVSYDHRRSWIRDRLEALFGVEVAAFAVLSNHVHVILRIRPDVVDLNPIRAGRPYRPEAGELTSARERILALLQADRARPAAGPAESGAIDDAPASPAPAGVAAVQSMIGPEQVPEAATQPGEVEPPLPRAAEAPPRRDRWLCPIELDERAEPLTTASATARDVAAPGMRGGCSNSRPVPCPVRPCHVRAGPATGVSCR